MLFGIPEIQEYEKTCTDPYVLAIIKKLWESKNNAAKWNNAYNELHIENKKLETQIEEVISKNTLLEDNLEDARAAIRYARKNN